MASTFEGTAPIKRTHSIEGYDVNMVIDKDGIHIQRKGDKNREKPQVDVSWTDILEIGADKMKAAGKLVHKGKEFESAYDYLGLE